MVESRHDDINEGTFLLCKVFGKLSLSLYSILINMSFIISPGIKTGLINVWLQQCDILLFKHIYE